MYERGTPIQAIPGVDRRQFLGAALALAGLGRSLSVSAQESTPANHAEGDADALAHLEAAGKAVLALDTFTFAMETSAGSSTILPGIELVSVEGKVRRPMEMSATLTVSALIQTLEIGAVAVDGAFYIQNPLSGGAWENMGSAPELVSMINPDWILMLALNQVQDAQITDDSDGTTLIEGYFDLSKALDSLDEESRTEIGQFLADSPVDVAFWIDDKNLITKAELYGPIFASESADVEKRIELSGFNEPVEIEAPKV